MTDVLIVRRRVYNMIPDNPGSIGARIRKNLDKRIHEGTAVLIEDQKEGRT